MTLRLLAVTLAYLGSGLLGLQIAIPPGYATLIWPPSGLALAAILAWGEPVWPGIALGSFLINAWIGFHGDPAASVLQALALAAVTAFGATAQALLGGRLLRRAASRTAADSPAPIGRLLLFGGFFACLINPTLSVGIRYLSGALAPGNVAFNWMVWWGGDVFGVFIFTPLCLVWHSMKAGRWQRPLLISLSLATCFLLTVLLVSRTLEVERSDLMTRFTAVSEGLAANLHKAIISDIASVGAVEALFSIDRKISAAEFGHFSAHVRASVESLVALEWVPLVRDAERARFETWASGETGADFVIREMAGTSAVPAGARAEYFPVTFVEPLDANRSAISFDLGSRAERFKALSRSRDEGAIAVTERIELVQDGRNAVLVAIPVYPEPAVPSDAATRHASLVGFALGVVRLVDMVNSAFANADLTGIRFWLRDETDPAKPQLLHSNTGGDPVAFEFSGHGLLGSTNRMAAAVVLPVGGRNWVLHLAPNEIFVGRNLSPDFLEILIAGLLCTGSVGLFVLTMTGREQLLKDIVDAKERTLVEQRRFLSLVSHEFRTPLAIIGTSTDIIEMVAEQGGNASAVDGEVAKIRRAIARTAQLIETCLSDEWLDTATMRPQFRPVDVPALLLTIIGDAEAVAGGRGITRRIPLDSPSVTADSILLTVAFTNIIDNAIKYTPEGSEIDVLLNFDPSQICVVVADRGPGISPEETGFIFERFYRSSKSSHCPGAGLGLYLVKRIVELHDGSVITRAREGGGCEFVVSLPLRRDGWETAAFSGLN